MKLLTSLSHQKIPSTLGGMARCVLWLIVAVTLVTGALGDYTTNCSSLLPGQYLCLDLNIAPETQQPRGCTEKGRAKVVCQAAPGIICTETNNGTFEREIPCKYTNGYSYETALLLSVFLGMFGVDRIYLGYYAVGLAKFCTLGFLFLGQLIDIILIATQTVGPADGSHYVISYYGAGIEVIQMNNMTYRMPQSDWKSEL
ncbi:TM2 domain-containing protein CG10795-like [Penaeus japonicus]|uniref:TM2 domain-containing protein CG10795-like n=1 Tax=Penaeus japonicus TaxID=27405 RepID=UPI001C70E4E1|nr:TM2 domain-containing protein CG10795-like [Penaeus japonicus]